MAKEKLKIDEVLGHEQINTFEEAEKSAQEIKQLKAQANTQIKKAGRPVAGKTKATNKIAFVVDDDVLDYLWSLADRTLRTPNAVAKKLLMANYEIHKKE